MRVLLNLPLGRRSDSHGRKPLMVAGTVITAAGAVATGLAGSLPAILAGRLLTGVGSAASNAGTQARRAHAHGGGGSRVGGR